MAPGDDGAEAATALENVMSACLQPVAQRVGML